ncbi:MAG: efflux RND transporter permease subunit, partial [Planctomycetes bacterium]|nr:efflux RND transporter permease subunit [Planctomycetota bacterium]
VLKSVHGNAAKIKEEILELMAQFMIIHKSSNIEYAITLDSTVKIADSLNVLSSSLYAACILVILTLFWFLAHTSGKVMVLGTALGVLAGGAIMYIPNNYIVSLIVAVFVLFVFSRSRASVLTVSGIVFSFVGSIIVLYLNDYSLNEITLLGFVITIGIIVDDAVVVLENIQRHREQGSDLFKAALDGTSEVFWPVFSATCTTMAAFLPMLLMTGSTGQFFALIPKAVCIALVISLFECFFILPVHALDMATLFGEEKLPAQKDHGYEGFLEKKGILGRLHRFFHAIMSWNLSHPFLALFLFSLLFFSAIGLLTLSDPKVSKSLGISPPLRVEFFPADASQCWAHVRLSGYKSVEETDRKVKAICKAMMAYGPGKIANATGISGLAIDSSYQPIMGQQIGMIQAELASRENRDFENATEFIERMNLELNEKFKNDDLYLLAEPMKDGPPTGADVHVRISGINEQSVFRLTEDLFEYIKSESVENGKFDGVINLTHSRESIKRKLKFILDDESLARYGLDAQFVQSHISGVFDGLWVGDLRRSDSDIPIKVKLKHEYAGDFNVFLSLPLLNEPGGRVIRYGDVGRFEMFFEPSRLERRNYERSVAITASLEDGAVYSQQFMTDWFEENQAKYPGAVIAFGGEAESTSRSYASLLSAFLLAVFLVYGILATQFRSYLQPFVIMSNILFALTGVVLTMAAFGIAARILGPGVVRPERSWLTVNCFLAVVGLAGLVVNDAIVLIDFINKRRNEGMSLREALLTGSHQRLRPILMTTITTIAGLLPMAIGMPDFSITWSPFATAFVAGLIMSTSMTLTIIPVLYELVDMLGQASSRMWYSIFKKENDLPKFS